MSNRGWRRAARTRASAIVAGVAVLCAGCAGQQAAEVAPPTRRVVAPTVAPTATPVGPVAPLTGAPVGAPEASTRPAVAVVVRAEDGAASPQGLDAADVVYEEFAEPGLRRMLTLFSSSVPDVAGPVSGTRPLDRDLLRVVDPVLVYSGSYKRFAQQIGDTADLTGVTTSSSSSSFRQGADGLPYAVLARVYEAVGTGRPAAVPLLTYATAGDELATSGRTAATSAVLAVPGHAPQTWRYDAATGAWSDGSGLTAQNVLLQTVQYKDIVTDKSGHSVPSARVVGDGAMQAFSGDQTVVGTWHKPKVEAVTNYVDATLVPVRLRPGRTVVLLAPATATVTVA